MTQRQGVPWYRRLEDKRLVLGAGAVATVIVLAVSLGGNDDQEEVEPENALDSMSVAFVDYPDREEIEPLLIEALSATGTVDTNENRSRAGSTLVALRKKNGTTEMEMLRCIPTVSGGELPMSDFPEAAALCSVEGRLSQ